jgi:hypothetical protein
MNDSSTTAIPQALLSQCILNVGSHRLVVSKPKCTSPGRSFDYTDFIVEAEEYGGEWAEVFA